MSRILVSGILAVLCSWATITAQSAPVIVVNPVPGSAGSTGAFNFYPYMDPVLSGGLSISNGGGGTLNWSVNVSSVSGGNWLTVQPLSGTGPGTITLTANRAGLAIGSYQAVLTVSAPGAANSPVSLSYTCNILNARLTVIPGSVSISEPNGSVSVLIETGGFPWSATSVPGDLQLIPSSGPTGQWVTIKSLGGQEELDM